MGMVQAKINNTTVTQEKSDTVSSTPSTVFFTIGTAPASTTTGTNRGNNDQHVAVISSTSMKNLGICLFIKIIIFSPSINLKIIFKIK